MAQAQDLVTNGYVERAIIDGLVTDGYNTALVQTPKLTRHVQEVEGFPDGWDILKARHGVEPDEIASSSVRRAANRLEEKGLVRRWESVDEEEAKRLPYDDFLTMNEVQVVYRNGDVRLLGRDDERTTLWMLTEEGAAEAERLDKAFFEELKPLLQRFGRYDPAKRIYK